MGRVLKRPQYHCFNSPDVMHGRRWVPVAFGGFRVGFRGFSVAFGWVSVGFGGFQNGVRCFVFNKMDDFSLTIFYLAGRVSVLKIVSHDPSMYLRFRAREVCY